MHSYIVQLGEIPDMDPVTVTNFDLEENYDFYTGLTALNNTEYKEALDFILNKYFKPYQNCLVECVDVPVSVVNGKKTRPWQTTLTFPTKNGISEFPDEYFAKRYEEFQQITSNISLNDFSNDDNKLWDLAKSIENKFDVYVVDEYGEQAISLDRFIRLLNQQIETNADSRITYYVGNILKYRY